MKKYAFLTLAALSLLIGACSSQNNNNSGQGSSSATTPTTQSSQSSKSSVSQGPKKSINITSISLTNDNSKAYIRVIGTQENYTTEDFKWAWGLRIQNGDFIDGKEYPQESDFTLQTFDENNQFTLRYCLTDIDAMVSGTLYRIYGGTPESYNDIAFPSNNFGASDATRHYYLRSDENNSLVYDSIQPISFTKAEVVEIAEADLPEGIINAGPYIKFGGQNKANLTVEMIDSWREANKIAGNFQRVIGEYLIHNHIDEELFWKIEEGYVYFYCYIGFIAEGEGWMTHFDLVSGNSGAGLQFESTIKGDTPYVIGDHTYRVYADTSKSGEENYWGCLGIYCEPQNS